jgi:hypothetical protein
LPPTYDQLPFGRQLLLPLQCAIRHFPSVAIQSPTNTTVVVHDQTFAANTTFAADNSTFADNLSSVADHMLNNTTFAAKDLTFAANNSSVAIQLGLILPLS